MWNPSPGVRSEESHEFHESHRQLQFEPHPEDQPEQKKRYYRRTEGIFQALPFHRVQQKEKQEGCGKEKPRPVDQQKEDEQPYGYHEHLEDGTCARDGDPLLFCCLTQAGLDCQQCTEKN